MYATNAIRTASRASRKAANPNLCSTCIVKEHLPDKKSCQPCLDVAKTQYIKHKEAVRASGKKRRTETPLSNMSRMVSQAKNRAGGDITARFILDMWNEQHANCALSGLKMTWGGGKLQPNTLSMDRIDPSKGYFVGNVRLVCHAVNMFRGRMTDGELLVVAEALVDKLRSI